MRVIIDTEAKQISIIGIVTVEELNELVVKHSLQDYVLAAHELQTHFVPHNWELTPPFYPDCNAKTTGTTTSTGKGIKLKDYTVLTT